jgi:ribokinase
LDRDIDIVLCGSLNVDFIAFVEHLPVVGETISTRHCQIVSGGKAANQAVAASRLGANVAMIGRVGDDELGRRLKADLVRDGINAQHVWPTVGVETGISMIAVNPEGQNTIVTSLGANAYVSLKDIDNAESLFQQAKFAMLQMEMEQAVGEYFIRKAYEKGVRLVLNLAPVVPIDSEVLRMVALLIVNETEATQLTGMPIHSLEDAERAAEALWMRGVEQVIITLGANGAILKTAASLYHVSSPKVQAVDSTAAGDCFVAATTHFWKSTGDLYVAVQHAVKVAALSVTKKGAQSSLPNLAEYLKFSKTL